MLTLTGFHCFIAAWSRESQLLPKWTLPSNLPSCMSFVHSHKKNWCCFCTFLQYMHTWTALWATVSAAWMRTRESSRSKKTASRFLLADGKDPVSNVAEIFTVSSKVFSREAGVVAITTKSRSLCEWSAIFSRQMHCVPYSGPNKRNKPFDVRTELSMIPHSQVSPWIDTLHAPVRLCHHVHLVVGAIITLELHVGFPYLFRVWALSVTQGSVLHTIWEIKTNSILFQCWSFTSMGLFWLYKFEVARFNPYTLNLPYLGQGKITSTLVPITMMKTTNEDCKTLSIPHPPSSIVQCPLWA